MATIPTSEILTPDGTKPRAFVALDDILSQPCDARFGRKVRKQREYLMSEAKLAGEHYGALLDRHSPVDADGKKKPLVTSLDATDPAAFVAEINELLATEIEIDLLSMAEMARMGFKLRGETWGSAIVADDMRDEKDAVSPP